MRILPRESNDDPHREFRIHQHIQRIGKLLRLEEKSRRPRIKTTKAEKVVMDNPDPTFTYCEVCLAQKTIGGKWVMNSIYDPVAHWSELMSNGCSKRIAVCKKRLTMLVGLDYVMTKWERHAEEKV